MSVKFVCASSKVTFYSGWNQGDTHLSLKVSDFLNWCLNYCGFCISAVVKFFLTTLIKFFANLYHKKYIWVRMKITQQRIFKFKTSCVIPKEENRTLLIFSPICRHKIFDEFMYLWNYFNFSARSFVWKGLFWLFSLQYSYPLHQSLVMYLRLHSGWSTDVIQY